MKVIYLIIKEYSYECVVAAYESKELAEFTLQMLIDQKAEGTYHIIETTVREI